MPKKSFSSKVQASNLKVGKNDPIINIAVDENIFQPPEGQIEPILINNRNCIPPNPLIKNLINENKISETTGAIG